MVRYVKINKKNAGEASKILKETFDYIEDKEELKFFDDYSINPMLVDGENFYIEVDKEIAGICGWYLPKADPSAVWLSWLAIKPDFRRMGLAKQAIKHCNARPQKKYWIDSFRVYTGINNKEAISLYKKLGYEEDSTYNNAIVFSKGKTKWCKEPIW